MDAQVKERMERIKAFEKAEDKWLEDGNNAAMVHQTVSDINGVTLMHHLNTLLPYILKLVDNYIISNKVIGVRCVAHIIENLTLNELKTNGIHELLFDSLKRTLHQPEAILLDVSLPVILKTMKYFKFNPLDATCSCTPCDDVLLIIERNLDLATSMELKTVYMKHLPAFISFMEIAIAKHMKKLISTLCENINPPSLCIATELVVHSLTALKTLIQYTWPVIDHYYDEILFALLKLCVNICDEKLSMQKDEPLITDNLRTVLRFLKAVNLQAFEDRTKEIACHCNREDIKVFFLKIED